MPVRLKHKASESGSRLASSWPWLAIVGQRKLKAQVVFARQKKKRGGSVAVGSCPQFTVEVARLQRGGVGGTTGRHVRGALLVRSYWVPGGYRFEFESKSWHARFHRSLKHAFNIDAIGCKIGRKSGRLSSRRARARYRTAPHAPKDHRRYDLLIINIRPLGSRKGRCA